jgi:hypothetical protein
MWWLIAARPAGSVRWARPGNREPVRNAASEAARSKTRTSRRTRDCCAGIDAVDSRPAPVTGRSGHVPARWRRCATAGTIPASRAAAIATAARCCRVPTAVPPAARSLAQQPAPARATAIVLPFGRGGRRSRRELRISLAAHRHRRRVSRGNRRSHETPPAGRRWTAPEYRFRGRGAPFPEAPGTVATRPSGGRLDRPAGAGADLVDSGGMSVILEGPCKHAAVVRRR